MSDTTLEMTLEDCLLPKIEVESEDDECSVAYFRALLASETKRLSNLCDSWEKKLVFYKGVISDVTEVKLQFLEEFPIISCLTLRASYGL